MSTFADQNDLTQQPCQASKNSSDAVESQEHQCRNRGNNFFQTATSGTLLSLTFLGIAIQSPSSSPLHRYFLGHPIAIAATVLFCFAVAILFVKTLGLNREIKQFRVIRDEDLTPDFPKTTPAETWHSENNIARMANQWSSSLSHLPTSLRESLLVERLSEIVHRQSQRGSSKLLADDLRELSGRDADAAHDSYGLVRIISWAIPMLGFLGTVIGITQTLGGLDFSNGSAAVDNLKSGLYVAFDTTAVGLVLSVLAIFIQFPIERREQKLLSMIDARVGNLVCSILPNEERDSNDPIDLIATLLDGIQTAVAESLSQQTILWRETIVEAQRHWQDTQSNHAEKITKAIQEELTPTISLHAQQSASTIREFQRGLDSHAESLALNSKNQIDASQQYFDTARNEVLNQFRAIFDRVCDHQSRSTELTLTKLQELQVSWSEKHQKSDTDQKEELSRINQISTLHTQTESLLTLQKTLDANLQQIQSTNNELNRQISNDLSHNLTEAMRYLARTVDQLSNQLGQDDHRQGIKRSAA